MDDAITDFLKARPFYGLLTKWVGDEFWCELVDENDESTGVIGKGATEGEARAWCCNALRDAKAFRASLLDSKYIQ